MGDFDQDLPQPGISLAGLSSQPLAPALFVAGAHTRPGSQMLCVGETAHAG